MKEKTERITVSLFTQDIKAAIKPRTLAPNYKKHSFRTANQYIYMVICYYSYIAYKRYIISLESGSLIVLKIKTKHSANTIWYFR